MSITNLQHQWTSKQALIFVTACLAVGMTGGWLIRGHQNAKPSSSQVARASAVAATANTATVPPSSLREMADTQAAPLLAKLNASPNDPEHADQHWQSLLRRATVSRSGGFLQSGAPVAPL